MTARTSTKTRTPRTRKSSEPQTVLIGGAEVLAETDPNEVAEAVAEIKAEPKPAKKLTNRELAVKAVETWNAKQGTALVFANHVKGNLLADGEAWFAVLDGDSKLRARLALLDPQAAEVSEVFDPAKAEKADKASK